MNVEDFLTKAWYMNFHYVVRFVQNTNINTIKQLNQDVIKYEELEWVLDA